MQELIESNEDVPKKLESETAKRDPIEKVSIGVFVTCRVRAMR